MSFFAMYYHLNEFYIALLQYLSQFWCSSILGNFCDIPSKKYATNCLFKDYGVGGICNDFDCRKYKFIDRAFLHGKVIWLINWKLQNVQAVMSLLVPWLLALPHWLSFSYLFYIALSVSSTVKPFLSAVVVSYKEPRTRKESLWRPLSSKSAWKITILRRTNVSVVLWSWRTFPVPSSRSVFLVMPHTATKPRQMTSLAWTLKLWKS